MYKPAKCFILGSQRSGTTLLGLCLEAHPEIEVVEESDDRFHQPYFLTKRIDLEGVNDYQSPGRRAICFKSPRDSHRVKAIFAKMDHVKILWMWRGVHEVVASMLRLHPDVSGTSWAMRHAEHELIKYLFEGAYDPRLAKSCRAAISNESPREKLVSLACLCWLAKARCELLARQYFGQNVHRVDYGKLVTNPEEELKNVVEFLDLSWSPRVLSHKKFTTGKRPGGTTANRALDSTSLNKWRSELLDSDIEIIDNLLNEHPDAV